ncbi:hypothetical protein LguiA_012526 [Lonicera macranthoides]
MKAQHNHTLNQSAKEGNKGKFRKGREVTDLPLYSKQHPTAKTNSSLHISSGSTPAQADNNVLNDYKIVRGHQSFYKRIVHATLKYGPAKLLRRKE